MHAVDSLSVRSSSKRSLPVSVVVVVVVVVVNVTWALSAAVPSSAVESLSAGHIVDGSRPPTSGDRRRGPRRATVDDVRAVFGGIEDADQQTRLTELANRDMAAAVLEYNEMILAMATGNGSAARTCWMRLNYNVTASLAGLTDLFRDQVTRHDTMHLA